MTPRGTAVTAVKFTIPTSEELRELIKQIELPAASYTKGLDEDAAASAVTKLTELLYGLPGDTASGIFNMLANNLAGEYCESNYLLIEWIFNEVHPMLVAGLKHESKPDSEPQLNSDMPEEARAIVNQAIKARELRNDIRSRVNSVIIREAIPQFITALIEFIATKMVTEQGIQRPTFDEDVKNDKITKLVHRWRQRHIMLGIR